MKLTFLIFPSFILISCMGLSCKADTIWSDSAAEVVKKEITTTLLQYHKDIAEKGLLAELDYLDSSAMFSWHPPGYGEPIGYDSVVSVLKESAPYYLKMVHRWDTLTVLPSSKTKGIYIGEVTSMVTDTTGRMDILRFKEEGMMIKRADGWKLVTGKTILID